MDELRSELFVSSFVTAQIRKSGIDTTILSMGSKSKCLIKSNSHITSAVLKKTFNLCFLIKILATSLIAKNAEYTDYFSA